MAIVPVCVLKLQKHVSISGFRLVPALVMGIAGILMFLLTENMYEPMVLVDRWTIVNGAIFVVTIVAIIFMLTAKNNNNRQTKQIFSVQSSPSVQNVDYSYNIKICSVCGAKNAKDAQYCDQCREKFLE
ncbi:MAG: hypothetical protein LBC03_00920 [Nitrososphaerota archaeon]|nr:hypothetical protein [Nitrososphaerota archaeon]